MSGHGQAVLLDRDGTIIVDRGYLHDPEQVEFERDAVAGMARLAAAGLPLVVLSNQSGIARGYFDEAAVASINDRLAAMLGRFGIAIAGWYICPHGPFEECSCRKPAPGLALQAAGELRLDLGRCWMIGDKRSDLELADAVGATGILVTTGEGETFRDWATADGRAVCGSLLDVATLILDEAPASPSHATVIANPNGR